VSLAEKLNSATRTQPGLPCGVGKLLTELKGEDKEALEIIFSTRSLPGTVSNRQVHKILLEEGYEIAFASITLHRRKQCRCFTSRDQAYKEN
jgi:hypothetical protein